MYFLARILFPTLTWRLPAKEKILYLTFDDGPIPEVTPWVLATLKEYNALATFFCIGDNVRKHPEVYNQVLENGHAIGNHTMHHLNGWETKNSKYFTDVDQAEKFIKSSFFRPPYGKIKYSQIFQLKKKYKIIMWDVLSKDYVQTLTGQSCFEIVKAKATGGSIVVFHDSLKAEARLKEALPATLEHFSKLGYVFGKL
jgi:peptidoglycan/xylan/chitin deacetylase (PgdA/CDA1 family)